MYDDELTWLADQAQVSQVIIEIGVWRGRSAACLAEHTTGLVLAIDHFMGDSDTAKWFDDRPDGLRNDCLDNLREFISAGRLLVLQRPSLEAAPFVAELLRYRPADMVFVDGDHSYDATVADINAYMPILRSGGLICGHDSDFPNVRRAVDFALPGWQPGPSRIWYGRKP